MEKAGHWLLALAFSVVVSPAAILTSFSNPGDGTYLSSTTLVPIVGADLSTSSSETDGIQTISFSVLPQRRTVPNSWGTWAGSPFSETATPRVLYTTGSTITLNFSEAVRTFGVEMEPNSGLLDLTIEYFNGATSVGSITRNVNGSSGSRLFAATLDQPVTRVVLSQNSAEFAFAQMRYEISVSDVPEPATLGLTAAAIFLAVALRRRR